MKKQILLYVILISFIGVTNAQWQRIDSTSVTCIEISGSNIFAGAPGGSGIYYSSDNGNSWTTANNGLTDTIVTSLIIKGSNIFASTPNGGVFMSSNNGNSWIAVNNGIPPNINVVSLVVSEGIIFAGTYYYMVGYNNAGLLMSSDNGSNWSIVNTGFTGVNFHPLFANGCKIIGSGDNNYFYMSLDNGNSWYNGYVGDYESTEIFTVAIRGNCFYLGTDHGIYFSPNNGSSWSLLGNSNVIFTSCEVMSLVIIGNNIFAGTFGCGVYYSSDNGNNWTSINQGLTNLQVRKLVVSGKNIYVGTPIGIFKKSLGTCSCMH